MEKTDISSLYEKTPQKSI